MMSKQQRDVEWERSIASFPIKKPRVRGKAPTLMLGSGVPDDAQPGDLVVGNRGAAARVVQPPSQFGGLARVLTLEYAGNYFECARAADGCKTYDLTGGTTLRGKRFSEEIS